MDLCLRENYTNFGNLTEALLMLDQVKDAIDKDFWLDEGRQTRVGKWREEQYARVDNKDIY